jgi:hypothetical protein
MSHHQNAGQHHSLVVANNSFEKVSNFKYSGMTVTNQNCIYKEINAWFHSVQNLFFPISSPESLQIKTYKNYILHVLYGCETWSFTLREEQIEDVWEQGAGDIVWT